jgi:acyl-CoA thioester hydrolase
MPDERLFVFHFPFSTFRWFIMEGWHETEIRVRYAETDKMGIVHHSNYLIWFEAGRSDLCRARGFSYKEMEEQDNALMVVAESYVRYKSPAFYEDVLTVRTQVAEVRSRSIRFIYEIVRDSDEVLLAEGETLHLVTDENKKVKLIPEIYKERLLVESNGESAGAFPASQPPS